MLFGKKKTRTDISVGEIRKLSSSGMSDRDIIRNLKKDGYSYDEIERGMLEAVKEGVGDEEPKQYPVRQANASQELNNEEVPVGGEEVPLFEGLEEAPSQSNAMFTEDLPKPETIIEEIAEGVVEEKWKKFEIRLDGFRKEFDSVHGELNRFEQMLRAAKDSQEIKEFGTEVSEISGRLDGLDARIGGLEKAFKQVLPSLTRNIENLSEMIHEMKSKENAKKS